MECDAMKPGTEESVASILRVENTRNKYISWGRILYETKLHEYVHKQLG
jgi:hypothetical protein